MGKFVTSAGVEIEMNDEAARTIGFRPAGGSSEKQSKKTAAKKATSDKSDKK